MERDYQTVEEYIIGRNEYRKQMCELQERIRTSLAVTMVKRFRGDMYGYFGEVAGSRDWRVVPSAGLMQRNIFVKNVRANTSNWQNAVIRLVAEPTRADNVSSGAASVYQSLINHFDDNFWTEDFSASLCQLGQLTFNYFPRVRFIKPGEYYVHKSTDYLTKEKHELEEKPNVLETRELNQSSGEFVIELIPSWCIRIDEQRTKGARIQNAHWVCIHDYYAKYELMAMFPDVPEDEWPTATYNSWSEKLKWKLALEKWAGTLQGMRWEPETGVGSSIDELHETEEWAYEPITYRHYRAPEAFTTLNKDFTIKKGQTFQEAFEERGEEYVGLCIYTMGKKIISIKNKSIIKDELDMGGWIIDETAAWCKGNEDDLPFQEAVNEFSTIFFNFGMYNAYPHTIIDRNLCEKPQFHVKPGGVTYTRKGWVRDKPIRYYIERLMPGNLPQDLFLIYQTWLEGDESTMGVSKASIGQGDSSNQTFGGQQLLTNRAVGLVIPAKKIEKRCKKAILDKFARLFQRHARLEDYDCLTTKFGMPWRETDISAFQRADLKKDVRVNSVLGSDVPRTIEEREAKLGAAIQIGLFDPAMPIPDEVRNDTIQLAGIDYDYNNIKAHQRMARERYVLMKQSWLTAMKERDAALQQEQMEQAAAMEAGLQIETDPMIGEPLSTVPPIFVQVPSVDPMTGQPMIDEMGMPVLEEQLHPDLLMILQQPGVKILPAQDNHEVHIEFLTDQILAESLMHPPDEGFIALLQARYIEHEIEGTQKTMTKAAQMGLAVGAQEGAAQIVPSAGQAAIGQLNTEHQGDQERDGKIPPSPPMVSDVDN